MPQILRIGPYSIYFWSNEGKPLEFFVNFKFIAIDKVLLGVLVLFHIKEYFLL